VKSTHTVAYVTQAYEAGPENLAHPLIFVNRLQDAAGRHAEALGVGMSGLRERGMAWILAHSRLAITRCPKTWEKFTVTTWPSGRDRFYYTREFLFSGSDDSELARASTTWFVLDIARGRPLREPPLPPFPFRKEKLLDEDAPTSLQLLKKAATEATFAVQNSDLDVNGHANNAVFVRWALDTLPDEICRRGRLARLEANYRRAAQPRTRVRSSLQVEEGEGTVFCRHLLTDADEGEELARLGSKWFISPAEDRAPIGTPP